MEDESRYLSCRGCGSPSHTRNECPVWRQQCEELKRKIYESDAYQDDLYDALYYPSSSDYQIGFLGVNEEVKAYWESYNNDSYQYSQASYNQCQVLCQIPNNVATESELLGLHQSEEEARIARLDSSIHQYDEYLSTPDLPHEDKIHYLEMKCKFLKMKIQFEESVSPLPDDIRSYWEEEVVELNTTSNSSPNEEPRVECVIIQEEAKVIQILPDPIVTLAVSINECREEELMPKLKKVELQHIGHVIMEWCCVMTIRYFHYTSIFLMLLSSWCINYGAYIGNSVGKCSIRPP